LFWEFFCENQPKKLTWDHLMLPLIGTLVQKCNFPCFLVWTSMMWHFRQVTKSWKRNIEEDLQWKVFEFGQLDL
jgi:hypothetical protein